MDVLNHNFIRLGLTRAKALQTARGFPRETRRRVPAPKSNAFAPHVAPLHLAYPMIFMVQTDAARQNLLCIIFP